jgi:hypothetical protein
MSVVIYKPKNILLTKKDILDDILVQNPICINYVYADGKKLHIYKNKKLSKYVYQRIELLTEFPVLIHINQENKKLLKLKKSNWPPVMITKKIAIMGAGPVLKLTGEKADKLSPTKAFVSGSLREITKTYPDFLFNYAGQWMVENILTDFAAMISINEKGEVSIFNQKCGIEYDNGIWYFDSFTTSFSPSRGYQSWLWKD